MKSLGIRRNILNLCKIGRNLWKSFQNFTEIVRKSPKWHSERRSSIRLVPFPSLVSLRAWFADMTWSIGTHNITLKKWAHFSKWPTPAGVLLHSTKSLQSLVLRAWTLKMKLLIQRMFSWPTNRKMHTFQAVIFLCRNKIDPSKLQEL